jgi:hypothetical protein
MGVINQWLVNPTTFEHVALHVDERGHASERRRDARYFLSPTLEASIGNGAPGLAVRQDQLLCGGFVSVPFSFEGWADAMTGPWTAWAALGSEPARWAAHLGAPLALVEHLFTHVVSVDTSSNGVDLVFDEDDDARILTLELPLHPSRLAEVPARLQSLLSVHARFELLAESGLVAGWIPGDPDTDEGTDEGTPFLKSDEMLADRYWWSESGVLHRRSVRGLEVVSETPVEVLLREVIQNLEG